MTLRLPAQAVDRAAAILAQGGLVALPTETVYGLAGLGLDPMVVARIFAAKDRPADNPLILHLGDLGQAAPLLADVPRAAGRLERLAALWPGPVTGVVPASEHVPPIVTAGLPSVALRIPDHPVTCSVIAKTGPVAAPSANRSGRPSPTTADHVLETLQGRIDAVLDAGATLVGVESTVVDLTTAYPRILRPGAIGQEALSDTLREQVIPYDPAHVGASPGLRHRHYTPDVQRIMPMVNLDDAWASSDTLLLFATTASRGFTSFGPREAPVEVLPDDAPGAMRSLYAALYRTEGARGLRLEQPPAGPAYEALADRIRRVLGQSRR